MDVTTTKIVVLVIIGLVIAITLLGEFRPGRRGPKNGRRSHGGVDRRERAREERGPHASARHHAHDRV